MNINSSHFMDGLVIVGLLLAVIIFTWMAKSRKKTD